MIDFELIDTKPLLESLDIEFSDRGKNVTKGWVNITCPFCGDHSNHCGINLNSNMFHCWACQEKGNVIHLIHTIREISYRKTEQIAAGFLRDVSEIWRENENVLRTESDRQSRTSIVYPKPLLDSIPDPHRQYLLSRSFDPDLLTKKYHLKFTYNTGDYRFRIVAPIFSRGRAVSWIATDVIRDGGIPYIKCPLEMSILSANDCLYNIDSVGKTAILVEGITDVWRLGNGAVASMTKSINAQQILQLLDHGVEKVFVMYDSDANDRSKIAAGRLASSFEVSRLELDSGDPADLSINEVNDLRAEIFG